jgi:hypothetical protein
MRGLSPKILRFPALAAAGEGPRVGRVHRDGSITYRGHTYPTIKEVPTDWVALRPDLETRLQFIRLYDAIDPAARGHRSH